MIATCCRIRRLACSFLYLAGLLLTLSQCANPAPIPGGPEDETPPMLVEAKSTPNNQTNFEKQKIALTFDEWIQVKNVLGQIVVSPPLSYQPEVILKGKTVTFSFDDREELRENATYTINFGEAVQDFTANNPAEDLRFVFSTGPFIDSLFVTGAIFDAATQKPVEGVLVMLYDNLADSVVYREKPFYFGKTDANGRFRINNIRADSFKVFALEDANLNYLFDQALERIAFQDELIVLSDTISPSIRMRLSQPFQPPRVMDVNRGSSGRISALFNKDPNLFSARFLGDSVRFLAQNVSGDSLIWWYEGQSSKGQKLEWLFDEEPFDTTTFMPISPDSSNNLSLRASTTTGLHPKAPLLLLCKDILSRLDTSKILLTKDSLPALPNWGYVIDSIRPYQMYVSHAWSENATYQMTFLPGAIQGHFGQNNADTIEVAFSIGSEKLFGDLHLTVSNLDADLSYVLTVFKDDQVWEKDRIQGDTSRSWDYLRVKPGNLRLELVEDLNNNGRWDPGYYLENRQPERIFFQSIESIRANWEVNATVEVNFEE